MEGLLLKLIEGAVNRIGQGLAEQVITYPKLDRSYILLCVELGHLRCKIAFIDIQSGNRKVEISKLEIMSSENFYGEEGFKEFIELLQNKNISFKVDGLALSLCCPINSEKGIIDTENSLGWSHNLQEILHQVMGLDCILIVNDAVAFALGCKSENRINGLKLPILTITLGGAVGSAIIQTGKPFITPYEVGNIWRIWDDGFEGNPHMLAGQDFFDWVSNETSWGIEEKKRNFSQRLAWMINAIRDQKIRVNSVMIGGGNAAYIDVSDVKNNLNQKCKLILSRQPEIPLYGLARLWLEHFHYGHPISNFIDGNIKR
jgi:hypothetical protein